MAKSVRAKWTTASLSPLEIALDRQNPRINILSDDTEVQIVKKLIAYEEIIELAKKISKSGLLPGERPIVVKEHGQYVVLEGNRRICACKLLLSPELIPLEYRKVFPALSTSEDIDRIKKVQVDVSPDRRTAEPILTLRHTETGIRRWRPIARMRRVMRLLDEEFTVEQIAAEYQESPGKIRKTIREYRLLSIANQLKGLTRVERAKLDDPDLKTNPFTRFFDLSGVKEYLAISFSDNGTPHIEPPRKTFDTRMKLVVRAFLNEEDFDTRTDPVEVFGPDFKKFRAALKKRNATPTQAKAEDKKAGDFTAPVTPPPPSPPPSQPATKPDRFFESLSCRIQSHQIASVVFEIKKINPDLYPISGTYLLRTLIELCLRQLIKTAGLTTPGPRDPSLTDLVKFSLQNRDKVFSAKRMADVIESAYQHKSFDYLNIVAHQQWMNADPTALKSTANTLRNFIQFVLEDEA
jgi:ParB-like nuclease domain